MPTVVVRTFGPVREILGSREVEVKVGEGPTIGRVLKALTQKYGKALEAQLFLNASADELQPRIRVLLNGQNMATLKGMNTTVKDGDVVTIFPPAGGG